MHVCGAGLGIWLRFIILWRKTSNFRKTVCVVAIIEVLFAVLWVRWFSEHHIRVVYLMMSLFVIRSCWGCGTCCGFYSRHLSCFFVQVISQACLVSEYYSACR